MFEWNIQSRAHACTACDKPFVDKQTYHTLLFDERADFRRSDICGECWEKQYSDGARDRKGFISYWHGIYEAPQPRPEPIQKENAESLLRKIVERNDPHYGPAAFILAVMLERKRLLKVKEQLSRDGRRVFIYEQPKTGDLFTIADPDLQLNQLEVVQRDVAELLENGLPEPTTNPPSPGDAAAETSAEPGSVPAEAAVNPESEALPAASTPAEPPAAQAH